jgi:tetratricopeptide (TPR) repeat protein
LAPVSVSATSTQAASPGTPIMAKIGRNNRCPCGSGKKHKHCCLRASRQSVAHADPGGGPIWLDDDDLDELSNSVVDLVAENRLDDAEAVSRRLLADYPDVIDGHERLALVYEKRGDARAAARHYRAAVEIIDRAPADHYSPELRDSLVVTAERLDPSGSAPAGH